jgi:uncharacterized membrane protein
MEHLAIKTGGILSILLGIGHCFFYRGFGWEKEFQNISSINAKALYTIHIFLIPLFFLFGYLSWMYPDKLSGGSPLGITLTAFYAVFWLLRAIWQMIYFSPAKAFEPSTLFYLHYFLSTYFIALFISYSIPVYGQYFN